MMEGPDLELELVGVIDESLEIGNGVAVSVEVNLSAQQGAERLPLQFLGKISLHVLHADCSGGITPVILVAHQLACLLKGVTKLPALAHTAGRALGSDSAVNALSILTAGHLHEPPVAFGISQHVGGTGLVATIGLADSQLDSISFTAHVVARTGQNQAGGNTAGLDNLDLVVIGLDAVDGADKGGDIRREFIGIFVSVKARQRVYAGMAVHVDDAGGKGTALGVKDMSALGQAGGGNIGLDLLDEAILEVDVGLDPAVAFTLARIGSRGALGRLSNPDRGVLDEGRGMAVDVAGILLATLADGVLGLLAQLGAGGEVVVQALHRQAVDRDVAVDGLRA